MIQCEPRIAIAATAIFTTLAGVFASLHGMIFDKTSFVRFGVAAIAAGIAVFVVMLSPRSHED